MSIEPSSAMGTIGAPVAEGQPKAALLELAQPPVGRTESPSGAIQMLVPPASARPACSSAACDSARLPARSTGTKPAAFMARPQIGTLNSSILATMRSRDGHTQYKMGMSKWL